MSSSVYPTSTSGSIRQISLSPFNENSPSDAYGLVLDESNRVTITKCNNNAAPSMELSKSFPLAGSPRAAVWCPFAKSSGTASSDFYCLVTSCVGCPVQLRYFSESSSLSSSSDDDQSHDPAWVEGTYKCYDDLDYLISANTISWHRSRKGQLVCGFDKGYLGIFDVERPGRELTWRYQVNSLSAFQNCTSHNRKVTNGQHAVSAIAVHETKPDLIACGTRSGFMPIFDCRMKLAACILKCDNNNNNNNDNNQDDFGHAVNSAITEIQFDPNSEYFVYSTSRGKGRKNANNNTLTCGVIQHDLRKPQVASGILVTREISANNNNIHDAQDGATAISNNGNQLLSTMQPIHFSLVNSSESTRLFAKFGHHQEENEEEVVPTSSSSSSFIVSGNPAGSDPILGYCSKNGSQNSLVSSSESNLPLTAVAVCTKRGIMVLGGGQRQFAEPDEEGEDLGKMEIGKIRGRDLPRQASAAFAKVIKF